MGTGISLAPAANEVLNPRVAPPLLLRSVVGHEAECDQGTLTSEGLQACRCVAEAPSVPGRELLRDDRHVLAVTGHIHPLIIVPGTSVVRLHPIQEAHNPTRELPCADQCRSLIRFVPDQRDAR